MLSASVAGLPTGPTIVVAITIILIFSILFAGRRGIVWRAVRTVRNRRRFELDGILRDLHALAERHHDDLVEHGHSIHTLELMSRRRPGVRQGLDALSDRGLAYMHEDGSWSLTEMGHARAEQAGGSTG